MNIYNLDEMTDKDIVKLGTPSRRSTDSPNPNNYWKVLKNRLKKEGSQLVTVCNQL